jgi:hypothetical protein
MELSARLGDTTQRLSGKISMFRVEEAEPVS